MSSRAPATALRRSSAQQRRPAGDTPAACCTPLGALALTEGDARTTAALFKALSDPARVRLVNLLTTRDEPVCVCELTEEIGLSQPTVSFHLKKLTTAGLVRREQRGTWAYYSIDRDVLDRLHEIFDTKEKTG